jgi:hypothetical protein
MTTITTRVSIWKNRGETYLDFFRLKDILNFLPLCHEAGKQNDRSMGSLFWITALFFRLPPSCLVFLLCSFRSRRISAECSMTYAITLFSIAHDTM